MIHFKEEILFLFRSSNLNRLKKNGTTAVIMHKLFIIIGSCYVLTQKGSIPKPPKARFHQQLGLVQ